MGEEKQKILRLQTEIFAGTGEDTANFEGLNGVRLIVASPTK